jgi:hypothetical protein
MADAGLFSERVIRFFVFRYSLLPPLQLRLDTPELPTPKGEAILPALGLPSADLGFRYWGRQYAFVGFSDYANRFDANVEPNRVFIGKMAKHRVIRTGELVPGDVIGRATDTWTPVWVVVDTRGQYIAVQSNAEIGRIEQVKNILTAGLRPYVRRTYEYAVVVEPLTDPAAFWDVVETNELLHAVEVNLVSPNILDTNRAARESLAALKEVFGQDEVTVKLASHSGTLRPARRFLDSVLEYIGNGEGWWRVAARAAPGRRKRWYTSRTMAKEIEVAIPEEMALPAEATTEQLASQVEDRRAPAERRIGRAFLDTVEKRDVA